MKRWTYSRATCVLPTPPSPYSVCGCGSTAATAMPPPSWSRIRSSTTERPVNPGLRGGAFQIFGTVPGKRGPGDPLSGSWTGRSSARNRAVVAFTSSSRKRSTGLRSMYGVVSRTSPTRTGSRWCRPPPGSSAADRCQTSTARADFRYALDSRTTVRAACSAGCVSSVAGSRSAETSRGTTRNPARVSRYSTQSAHIRFSAT